MCNRDLFLFWELSILDVWKFGCASVTVKALFDFSKKLVVVPFVLSSVTFLFLTSGEIVLLFQFLWNIKKHIWKNSSNHMEPFLVGGKDVWAN